MTQALEHALGFAPPAAVAHSALPEAILPLGPLSPSYACAAGGAGCSRVEEGAREGGEGEGKSEGAVGRPPCTRGVDTGGGSAGGGYTGGSDNRGGDTGGGKYSPVGRAAWLRTGCEVEVLDEGGRDFAGSWSAGEVVSLLGSNGEDWAAEDWSMEDGVAADVAAEAEAMEVEPTSPAAAAAASPAVHGQPGVASASGALPASGRCVASPAPAAASPASASPAPAPSPAARGPHGRYIAPGHATAWRTYGHSLDRIPRGAPVTVLVRSSLLCPVGPYTPRGGLLLLNHRSRLGAVRPRPPPPPPEFLRAPTAGLRLQLRYRGAPHPSPLYTLGSGHTPPP